MTTDMKEPSTPSTRSGSSTKHRLLENNFVQSTWKALSSPLLSDERASSKNDQTAPTTPQRPSGLHRGLSLQLPKQDLTSPSASKLSNSSNVPLSPKLDPSISFGSSILPRRSRGLDFSRACTNLHHSTLAESSPDSSPIVGNRGMPIPRRSGSNYESPIAPSGLWSTMGAERVLGTSIGSNAMETSDSSESDDELLREEDDIHMTPQQPPRSSFALANVQSPGLDPMASSPAGRRLANFAKRFKIKTKRRLPIAESPANLSPPLTRSGEMNGFFNGISRRESLNLNTGQLNLSDEIPQDALGLSHPQVIRRAVTRRSNMLPKPKGFARIRAALQEESSPIESENTREAAVIRHVRESDLPRDSQSTAPSSPSLMPMNSNEAMEELTSIMNQPREPANFGRQALRNSGGPEFWDNWDERIRTPPPPFPQRANSTVSEDVSMETTSSHPPSLQHFPSTSTPSRSSTPQPIEMRKTLGKRRRDDDFDPAIFKRRAVSPGLSHQNSPILPPSPANRDGSWNGWQAKVHRESSASSTGTPVALGKRASRVGMQGMNDTSDGMMNMSIE